MLSSCFTDTCRGWWAHTLMCTHAHNTHVVRGGAETHGHCHTGFLYDTPTQTLLNVIYSLPAFLATYLYKINPKLLIFTQQKLFKSREMYAVIQTQSLIKSWSYRNFSKPIFNLCKTCTISSTSAPSSFSALTLRLCKFKSLNGCMAPSSCSVNGIASNRKPI